MLRLVWIASPSARNDCNNKVLYDGLNYSEVDKKILKETESLVDKILKIKSKNSNENVSKIEGKIDRIVYKLYDLTEEEIRVVENR